MVTTQPDLPGGSLTSYAADTRQVRAAAGSLTEVAATVGRVCCPPISGTGEARAVEGAVAQFGATWSPALARWTDAVRTFAQAVTNSAALMEQSEAQAAVAWRHLRDGLPT